MLLSCQDKLLPGGSTAEKYENALRAGFDHIEINGGGKPPLSQRVEEITQAARASGITPSTVCGGYSGWIADFDAEIRRRCLDDISAMLPVVAAIGAQGLVVPAAYGMFSCKLPPFMPPRSTTEDEAVLVESLRLLGDIAHRHGVCLYLEPLNRYEDHMVNTVARAAQLVELSGGRGLGVILDVFHGNIEETDLPETIREYAHCIRHVHLADSNRLQPGLGHLDFGGVFEALEEVGYGGSCAFECGVQGEGLEPLTAAVRHCRRCMGRGK